MTTPPESQVKRKEQHHGSHLSGPTPKLSGYKNYYSDLQEAGVGNQNFHEEP